MANRKYRNEITNLGGNGQVPALECNCITFYNPPGNLTNLVVNKMPITPGCMFMLAGLEGEQDTSIYEVVLGSVSEVFYVIRKYYVE